MIKKIFINASNINSGGGLTLLKSFVKSLNANFNILLDSRVNSINCSNNCILKSVNPNFIDRFKAEYFLYRNSSENDIVLCFGNLPPLFKLKAFSVVFLQNRYLIENSNLNEFKFIVKIRIIIERYWFKFFLRNADLVVVQTESMRNIFFSKFSCNHDVEVLPFIDIQLLEGYFGKENFFKSKNFDFIYIASGDPHKNHLLLIDAWIILAEKGIFPSLAITIDNIKFKKIADYLNNAINKYSIKIINLGSISYQSALNLYSDSSALIFPSRLESFGLPLLEAKFAGISIIAPELDYVRDIVNPDETFDPASPISLARAVMRFLNIDSSLPKLFSPSEFLDEIYLRSLKK